MALPSITAPAGFPCFLARGHAIALRPVHHPVRFAQGVARQRRCYTAQQRVVDVAWFLSQARLIEAEQWYEQTLDAGAIEFAAEVRTQGLGTLWWRARWVDIGYEMSSRGRGTVRGKLLLTGQPETSGPA